MEQAKAGSRRRHDGELEKAVLAECAEPGASVASVALKHGLSANLVHKWRRLSRACTPAVVTRSEATQFVPVALPQTGSLEDSALRLASPIG